MPSPATISNFGPILGERLHALARTPRVADQAIDQWRLVVDSGTSAEVGLKDNMTGGPYDAPNVVTGTRGEIYLRWRDGRVSTGTVDRTTLDNLAQDLHLWRQAAHEDPFAPDVRGPQIIPDVPLYDAGVAAVVYEDHDPLFDMLERFRRELPPYEAERVSGSVTVSVHRRHLMTSAGLDHASEGTSVGAYADADHRAYDYLSLRRLPSAEEVSHLIQHVGATNRLLRQTATPRVGRQAIVLVPSVAEAMLNKFVLGNLDGQRVLSGASAFTIAQFEAQESLFHPDFLLAIDPLQPLSPGSYQLTREGVPAAPFTFVSQGCLRSPLLDLKHARKSGMAPTPLPRGGSSLRLGVPDKTFEELIAGLERGLIVYQLLGLHTQDGTRANFSLTVSQGLVVQDGRVLGHAKTLITGNFLTALREGITLGRLPGKDFPAVMLMGDVSPG